jgi:hypothetical protein
MQRCLHILIVDIVFLFSLCNCASGPCDILEDLSDPVPNDDVCDSLINGRDPAALIKSTMLSSLNGGMIRPTTLHAYTAGNVQAVKPIVRTRQSSPTCSIESCSLTAGDISGNQLFKGTPKILVDFSRPPRVVEGLHICLCAIMKLSNDNLWLGLC